MRSPRSDWADHPNEIEDDFAAIEDISIEASTLADAAEFDIAMDVSETYQKRSKALRAKSKQKYNKTVNGRAAKQAYNKKWYKTEAGLVQIKRENAAARGKTLEKYLNRPFVGPPINQSPRQAVHRRSFWSARLM